MRPIRKVTSLEITVLFSLPLLHLFLSFLPPHDMLPATMFCLTQVQDQMKQMVTGSTCGSLTGKIPLSSSVLIFSINVGSEKLVDTICSGDFCAARITLLSYSVLWRKAHWNLKTWNNTNGNRSKNRRVEQEYSSRGRLWFSKGFM